MRLHSAITTLLIVLASSPAGALKPTADLEDDLRRTQASLQEACKSQTKVVMDWAAFDEVAAPGCSASRITVLQMCRNAADALASRCRSLSVARERDAAIIKATLPGLTELRCTVDSKHEALARKWLAAHPDPTGSSCPRPAAEDALKAEVFQDQHRARPAGSFSLSGTQVTFAYTYEVQDVAEDDLWEDMKKWAGVEAPAPRAGRGEDRPAVSFAATRARVLKEVVLLEVRERYPDVPNKIRTNKHRLVTGPPKLLVFTLAGQEIAQEFLDENGNVQRVKGAIPDGPARKYGEHGSSMNPSVEIEITYKDNLRTKYQANDEKGTYVDGKRDGTWSLARYLEEQTWERGILKNVKTHWISWANEKRPDGALSTEQPYKNGRPGRMKYYDYEGHVITEKEWAILDDPQLAKPHGKIVNRGGATNLEKCRSNGDCRSGRCHFISDTARLGLCKAQVGDRPDLGEGHDCSRDSECLSGFCTSRYCE